MYRLVLNLSFDGSSFYGWQRQAHHEPTVQGLLEEKIGQIMNQKVSVVASGRTDRGAHALSQWAHVDIPKDPRSLPLLYKLNRLTPDTLRINKLFLGDRRFHAQQSCIKKKYIYKVDNSPHPSPFKLHYFHHERLPLDENILNKLATYLVETQDFKSFQSVGTDVENTVRTVYSAHWVRKNKSLTFHIVGDGFLKQMVRNIVGTSIWCSLQRQPEADFVNIIRSLDRKKAKKPAPAHGLFLNWVEYPQELLKTLKPLNS